MRDKFGIQQRSAPAGLAAWILDRLHGKSRPQAKLALLERITLAPRQTLSLVEAEGRRFLIVNGADGTPAFYALDTASAPRSPNAAQLRHSPARRYARLSW